MAWHADISQQELHWRVAQFIETYGSEQLSIAYLNRMTDVCYRTKQYAVDDDYFLTWAFFTPEHEQRFLSGDVGVLSIPGVSPANGKSLWVLDSNLVGSKILHAINALSPLSHGNSHFRMLNNRGGKLSVRMLPLRPA